MRIITNPDREHVKKIREALKNNNNYCPCCIVKSQDTKCMCKEFTNMMEDGVIGECHCGLYRIVED
jgi:ferredoxin-thioredoxin reductase catalytic subunit